jgi:GNAT superfamily N-acetyltransferase
VTEWLSAALAADHQLDRFACGQQALDEWLRDRARTAHVQGTARTWVWTAAGSNLVVAYFSVAPTQVVREELTSSQAGGVSVVPAYLLARLALDLSLRGQGLGGELLVDALGRIVAAADVAGGRLIVVDAIDEAAAAFYARHDFRSIRGDAASVYPRRMVMKIATARSALGISRP